MQRRSKRLANNRHKTAACARRGAIVYKAKNRKGGQTFHVIGPADLMTRMTPPISCFPFVLAMRGAPPKSRRGPLTPALVRSTIWMWQRLIDASLQGRELKMKAKVESNVLVSNAILRHLQHEFQHRPTSSVSTPKNGRDASSRRCPVV